MDLGPLYADARACRFVLLGEATHGTREFYALRAEITRVLIERHGFDAVAVEADWPDAMRVNRYVHGSGDRSADDALADFERFPRWMWRNREVRAFAEWLARHNRRVGPERAVGFYGLDLYSLYRSADAVIQYLQAEHPDQAQAARRWYACLDHVRDAQRYGYEAAFGMRPDCREAATRLLARILSGGRAGPARFQAAQNARVVANAERYYRAMYESRADTWNLRDTHMTDTLFRLRDHLREEGRRGRIVVWAHNSHVGDARATEMGGRGEHNLGQLVRERAGAEQVWIVGFSTHSGWVSAARDWGAAVEHRWVRPAPPGSYEHLLHGEEAEDFYLRTGMAGRPRLPAGLLHRAIGVIYRPESERASHYFHSDLARQYDAVVHVDETTAVEPLRPTVEWQAREAPETWPTGL
jgi:erythromycin esterase-like protein